MQSKIAISLLALGAAQRVLAAPVGASVEQDRKFDLVDSAAGYEASLLTSATRTVVPTDEARATIEEVLTSTLPEAEPLSEEASPLDFIMPPPIFDPAEPRPLSIFVTEDGEVRDLPKPPPISFTRPERLSAYDAGNQPKDTPYPPDFVEYERDPAFYPCPQWQSMAKTAIALVAFLVAAASLVLLTERAVARVWFGRSRRPSQSSGILEADPFLDPKRRQSMSGSIRDPIWSRSPSPPKMMLP